MLEIKNKTNKTGIYLGLTLRNKFIDNQVYKSF